MAHLLLMGASLTEVFATSMLESTAGFSKLWPTPVSVVILNLAGAH